MAKYKLEYIWLDGYEPVPNLRGKTQVKDFDTFPTLEQLPMWGFDGSSTRQAEGHSSDCLLKPVAVFPDPTKTNAALVMCEVLLPDGTPHPSNSAQPLSTIRILGSASNRSISFTKTEPHSAFPAGGGFPPPQGEYYTGVGYKNVGSIAREIVDTHLELCLAAWHQS
jgi:glutamine synthetase